MQDVLDQIIDQVKTAASRKTRLAIRGGGTRWFYTEPHTENYDYLDMQSYSGVISYEPSELVITARAGTPLAEIENLLAQNQQMLAFEPPRFGNGTIGGCIASGMSGPRRYAAGSLADFVLGTKFLNSQAEILKFGGEVMKNVAGYDLSRLLAGSMGMLGAILDVSIKVLPIPYVEKTCRLQIDENKALDLCLAWRSKPLPVSATAWLVESDGYCYLHVRLSGNESAVDQAIKIIGGDVLLDDQAQSFWQSIRDQSHDFFKQEPLWRLVLPLGCDSLGFSPSLNEWGGGLRWLSGDYDANVLRQQVEKLGGSVSLFKRASTPRSIKTFATLEPAILQIHKNLKKQFDPENIFLAEHFLALEA